MLPRNEITLPTIVGLVTYAACATIDYYFDNVVCHLYESSMRPSLFTGFFTLSGFLLSAKTFIVLNMKKEVYSTPHYLRQIRDKRKSLTSPAQDKAAELAKDPPLEIYKPLKEIGDLLIINVAMSLAASTIQFTLGLWPSPWTTSFCLAVASAAVTLLFFSLYYMAGNLNRMYQHFEGEAEFAIHGNKID